jgi:hypothetical protein
MAAAQVAPESDSVRSKQQIRQTWLAAFRLVGDRGHGKIDRNCRTAIHRIVALEAGSSSGIIL